MTTACGRGENTRQNTVGEQQTSIIAQSQKLQFSGNRDTSRLVSQAAAARDSGLSLELAGGPSRTRKHRSMGNPVAWRNGIEMPFSEMSVPAWDMGVIAGASIAEMARTCCHVPFRLSEHLDRLLNSCNELQFEVPYTKAELLKTAERIVDHNRKLITENDDLGIVVFVTAGSNPTYLGPGDLPGPTVGIHTFRLPFELWKTAAEEGVSLSIPDIRQASADSLPVQNKTRNRLHWWLADRQAHQQERGSRALLLDHNGHLTETSTSCFYALIDGCIVTPRNNVLNSMSRKLVEEAAANCDIPFEQRNLSVPDIATFQEAFVSSTPVGILRVKTINGTSLITESQSSVVPRLLETWAELTGINPLNQILSSSSASN